MYIFIIVFAQNNKLKHFFAFIIMHCIKLSFDLLILDYYRFVMKNTDVAQRAIAAIT